MDPAKTIVSMRLVGGHLSLDFVNTVDARRDRCGPDLLESYGDLITWSTRVRLIDPATSDAVRKAALNSAKAAEEALSRAKELREAMFGVLRSEAVGSTPPKPERDLFEAAVGEALRQRAFAWGSHGWAWRWISRGSLDDIPHRIAYETAAFIANREERRRVRECLGDNCGWLFLDTSRGGQRRWCSDQTCGSHSRVRRFRAKATNA